MYDLNEMILGYIAAALWSSTDNEGHPLDDIDGDLADETYQAMLNDCREFQTEARTLFQALADAYPRYTAEQMGHDYWLTRVGHGAGFWDRDLGVVGAQLTRISQSRGSVDLYVGDDGDVYQQ